MAEHQVELSEQKEQAINNIKDVLQSLGADERTIRLVERQVEMYGLICKMQGTDKLVKRIKQGI